MRHRHSFRLDRAGHAVQVNIRSGLLTETELLVDGREIAFHRERGPGALPRTLAGAHPDRPDAPYLVRIDRPAPGSAVLRCELEFGGRRLPMAECTATP
ncbi:hypothetical protein AB0K43_30405 [Kitasatospora sp. NPDC049258]|uniref:hypothetical protein n=1 Tax=Kitasatospora sp. NPDC049258 TaxID=3155394 RepID=UPI003417DDD5